MKNLKLVALAFSSLIILSCEKESDETPFVISGLTVENYPKMDGSTSTAPLNTLIACKLLGIDYAWEQYLASDETWYISPKNAPENFFGEKVKTSQTHNSFINLINGEVDIILSARTMSDDEKKYADETGVTLIETPVALDAFIFLANLDNPIKTLTIKQIQDIFTGKTTNWKQVGGNDHKINPYVRNANSGSQELMESMVMKGLDMGEWTVDHQPEMIPSMMGVFSAIRGDEYGLGYTVYYYKEQIVRDHNKVVKSISVDGVYPDKKSIKNKSYPLVAEVYAIVRSDLDRSSMAYKMYELLQTEAGKRVINESGYVAN